MHFINTASSVVFGKSSVPTVIKSGAIALPAFFSECMTKLKTDSTANCSLYHTHTHLSSSTSLSPFRLPHKKHSPFSP